jgi:pimeloyl-ACP methyl ester carboxylesterase
MSGPRLRRTIVRVLYVVVGAYLALCAAARLGYRVLLYPAPPDAPPALPADAMLLTLTAADGVPAHAAYFPAPDGARTIVLFHGNGETIAGGVDLALALRARGVGVALVEYRGYGVSSGNGARPSEEGLYRDADAVLDALAARGVGPERVTLVGISLGTGVASEMAHRGRASSLVLVSPYTSITAMAQRTAWFLPASLLIPDRFDTLAKAPGLRVPTLVVHGDADEVIPVAMGRAVASAIPAARLHIIQGGHHNDLFAVDDSLIDAIAAHAIAAR